MDLIFSCHGWMNPVVLLRFRIRSGSIIYSFGKRSIRCKVSTEETYQRNVDRHSYLEREREPGMVEIDCILFSYVYMSINEHRYRCSSGMNAFVCIKKRTGFSRDMHSLHIVQILESRCECICSQSIRFISETTQRILMKFGIECLHWKMVELFLNSYWYDYCARNLNGTFFIRNPSSLET